MDSDRMSMKAASEPTPDTQSMNELQILQPTRSPAKPCEPTHFRKSQELSRDAAPEAPTSETATARVLSKLRAIVVISQLLGLQLFSSFCNGIIVVGIPAIAKALHLQEGLIIWPTSAFYLIAGSFLLMAGSIADVVGTKSVNLAGSLLLSVTAIACGVARTSGELIGFRALQGLSNAIIVPSSVSIISINVEEGRPRNIGFASLGLAGPVGFSLGLVLGGVFVDTVGWRPAFYLAGAASFALSILGMWALPPDARPQAGQNVWKRLALEIDWVGTIVASAGLAMLSYVLAMLSADTHNIHRAYIIALLILSVAMLPAFIVWMRYQVKHSRPALIRNSLWRSSVFTSSCVMVLFTTAVTNCMELFSSLFFQEVQNKSALGASLRILPSLIAGALVNLSTGVFVNKMPVMWTVLISSALCATAPLLMAVIGTKWPYWYDAFFAQILTPLSSDILFTVGLLVISDVFPSHTQALGGAVFNTCAQLGTSIGLTTISVIAASTTQSSHYADKASPKALMVGYRASFWTMFAWMLLVCLICVLGLRRIGMIGLKRD